MRSQNYRSVAHFIVLLCLIGGGPPPASAQVPSTVTEADSLLIDGPSVSPRAAFFRSLVMPGWGQVYVGSPGRGATYFSLAAGSLWMTYVSRRQQSEARAQQQWLRDTGVIEATEETGLFVSRSQQFEDWATLSVFLFFFSGADAYVAAYLSDFEVGVTTDQENRLQLQASVPLFRR